MRAIRLVLAALVLGALLPLTPGGALTTATPAAAGPTFGADPLDDVRHWAAQHARCGLTANKLAALMLAPTYPETGAPTGSSPSPMTLSRWDDQPGLHSFGTVAGEPRAFWHPGVGAWQFDSAGLGAPFTAAQRIDTYVVSAQAAATMAARWCTNPTAAYVWAPWYGCNGGRCRQIFDTIYRASGDRLVNVTGDSRVTSRGGMARHTCTGGARAGTFTCWRIDPSRAQGHAAFAAPGYGPAPITAPFYVYAANGREYRHWLRADTGYARSIWATRPFGANARSALSWHRGETLVDLGPGGGGSGGGGGGGDDGGGAGFDDVPTDAWYLEALTWAVDGEVVGGFADGTFRAGAAVTRAQMVAWLWTLAGAPEAGTRHPFTDVGVGSWADTALSWAHGEGLVSGFADGTFRPGDAVNRAQFASMLWNLADRPVPQGDPPFTDVAPGAWHAPAIAWMVELGYASGFDGAVFRPVEPVNRAQAVSWLHAARRFDDVAVTAWYAPEVDWGRFRRVIQGFPDHTFRGADVADRAATAEVLWRLMDLPSAPAHAFTDVPAGDPAVSWAVDRGVATGYGDGTFRPGEPLTRAQAVMMLWKVAGQPAPGGPPSYTDVGPSAWYAGGLGWAADHGLVAGYEDGSFRPGAEVSRAQLTAWVSALAHTEAAWSPAVTPPSTVVFGP